MIVVAPCLVLAWIVRYACLRSAACIRCSGVGGNANVDEMKKKQKSPSTYRSHYPLIAVLGVHVALGILQAEG